MRLAPGKGRGVFAARDFEKDEVIERCPIVLLPPEQYPQYAATLLADYGFRWRQYPGATAIPLGYGCIYNHSADPNARLINDTTAGAIKFISIRPITAGEEITFHYGWQRHRVPNWYEDRWGLTKGAQRYNVSPTVAVAVVGGGAILAGAAMTSGVVAAARRALRLMRRKGT